MSKRRAILIIGASLAVALPVAAQTAAELRAQSRELQQRRQASYQRMQDAQSAARSGPLDFIVLQGATVHVRKGQLAARDSAALVRAFDGAAEELKAAFGDDGAALLADEHWLLWFSSPGNGVFELTRREQRVAVSVASPLAAKQIQQLLVTRAATALVAQSPLFETWIGGLFEVGDPERTHYFAYRQLVFHATDAGQRCARGVVADCSASLGVGTARSQLRYAIERDGPAVLRLMRSTPTAGVGATAALAAALGESEADFLSAWHARISSSGALRAGGNVTLLFTSLGWCALCAVAASRRRPR